MLVNVHQKRINSAINYIIENPGHSHSLEELAAISNYSEYHFHRVFGAYTNQTVAQFIWQQRLDKAAWILAYDGRSKISDIAEECGFSGAANFARSFRPAFGMSAQDLKGNIVYLKDRSNTATKLHNSEYLGRELLKVTSRQSLAHAEQNGLELIDEYGVFFRDAPSCQLGYLRNIGQYHPDTLTPLFTRMQEWLTAVDLPNEVIGISRSHPSITARWRCIYDVCGVLPEMVKLPDDMSKQLFPGGPAAVYRCELDQFDIDFSCQYILNWFTNEWLPRSRFQPTNIAGYEIYLKTPWRNTGGTYLIEFCIPIQWGS